MATIPNPATTEWVPLWDTNGVSAANPIHHTKHETGGTDEIVSISGSIITSGIVADARLSVNILKFPGGYPGGTSTWLRADGTFATLPSAPPLIHHTTHELGGSDVLQNNAWLSTANIFTQNQLIVKNFPELQIQTPGNTVKSRFTSYTYDALITNNLSIVGSNWNRDDVAHGGNILAMYDGQYVFYRVSVGANPANLIVSATLDSGGVLSVAGGLGGTPLNGSNITSGTIPDARLTSNVALKNIDNQFVAQTFASSSVIQGSNSALYFRDTSAPVNSTMWRILGYSDGNIHLESLNDALNVINGRSSFIRDGSFQALGGLNATPLNASYLTSGTIPSARYVTSGWFFPVVGGSINESGQDYRWQSGFWRRVGDVYHVWAYTQFNGPGGGGHVGAKGTINGNLQLKGFPAVGNPPGAPIIPATGQVMGAPFTAGGLPYYTNQQPGDTVGMYIYTGATRTSADMFRLRPNSNNAIAMTTNDINDDTQFMFYLFYFA